MIYNYPYSVQSIKKKNEPRVSNHSFYFHQIIAVIELFKGKKNITPSDWPL